jgi:glutamate synthase (NADPH/NADH) large chain
MSGGFGYVLDLDERLVNRELVDVEPVSGEHADRLRAVVREHVRYTDSTVGRALLRNWPAALRRFSVIVPRDYRRVLEATGRARAAGEDVDAAVMAAARV